MEDYRIKDINDRLNKLQMPITNTDFFKNNELLIYIMLDLNELNNHQYGEHYELQVVKVKNNHRKDLRRKY